MHARNGGRRTPGRGGKKNRSPAVGAHPTFVQPAAFPPAFDFDAAAATQTPVFGPPQNAGLPFVFGAPASDENSYRTQAAPAATAGADAGPNWFSRPWPTAAAAAAAAPPAVAVHPVSPTAVRAAPVFTGNGLPGFLFGAAFANGAAAADPATPDKAEVFWSCACCESLNVAASEVCVVCGVLKSVAAAASGVDTSAPFVAREEAAPANMAPPPPPPRPPPPLPPRPPPPPAAEGVASDDVLLREKMRLELHVERQAHDLELARADVAWLRQRLDALDTEVVAARVQSIAVGKERASAAASRDTELEVKELKQSIERERQAFLAERQRWKHEMEQRAGELKEVRAAERELSDKCKQLASEKSALERHAELARARTEAMALKEAAARKEVQLNVSPALERAQAEGIRKFLRFVYERFPPKDPQHHMGPLDALALDRTAKQALQHYHTDKQDVDLHGLVWRATCNEILAILNDLRSK